MYGKTITDMNKKFCVADRGGSFPYTYEGRFSPGGAISVVKA